MKRLQLAALAIVLAGACSSIDSGTVAHLRTSFRDFRRATVAHPSYGPSGVAAVSSLGDAIEADLAAIESRVR